MASQPQTPAPAAAAPAPGVAAPAAQTPPAAVPGAAPAADFTSADPNNTGDTFDATSFWGTEPDASESGDGPDPTVVQENLTQQLANLDFGGELFSADLATQINEGNFEGINARMQEIGTNMVKQSLAMTVSILRPLTEQIMGQVRDEINGTLTNRDDGEQLTRDFPAAKDPNVRPVVENLYRQALRNTKGNRTEAVAQVKSMMSLVTKSTADDLGLDVAPRGAEDFGRSRSPAINWLDELSGA
jgi:hypothetical protein